MITLTDAINSIEFEKYYVILPSMSLWDIEKFCNQSSSKKESGAKMVFRIIVELIRIFNSRKIKKLLKNV